MNGGSPTASHSTATEIQPSGEPEVEFSPRSYCKIILHAAKYPHTSINGVLLGKSSSSSAAGSRGRLNIVDCIPMFHQGEGLTPMLEVALAQIETRCTAASLVILGYYHANRSFRDTSVDTFSQRIADRVADHSPDRRAALVTVDNHKLSLSLQSHALIVQIHSGEAGKWKQCPPRCVRVSEDTLEAASKLLEARAHKDLTDFDNHLDDVTLDYLNVGLNMEIDRCY